ncbi:MAG: oligopeptidase A [Gammaproteobacteria bacterium]|nr:oligopeptidase A [Gammaproteobacteria bacterium]
MTNALLALASPNDLPRFDAVCADEFLPAVTKVIEQCDACIEHTLAAQQGVPDWQSLMAPIETSLDRLEQVWSVISHLNGVCNTPEVREAHAACLPPLTEFNTRMGQHRGLFMATRQLRDSDTFAGLSAAQQKIIANSLRDFRLAGVDLEAAAQQRFAEIKQRLAELTTQFSNHVLDATRAFSRAVDDQAELAGLPDSALQAAREMAREKTVDGYLFTLDIPSYLPLMQYCDNRALREEMYTVYVTRASEIGPNAGEFDNSDVMQEILALRRELAQLLGYDNYAELSLATKMASSADQVLDFLHDLADKAVVVARAEYAELQAFARNELGLDQLQAWDVPYAAEKLRVARYAVSQEELKPYFAADRVIAGMFDVVQRLYGLCIRAAEPPGSWHPQVRFYEVYDAQQQLQARFYLDLFARPGKRGGAWMADCKSRRRLSDSELQLPVAFLVCNFTPPSSDKPALLTHNEVTTLFHEFGHGLHHMLTQIDYAAVAGINGVPWDAVELPSQFMENWCWQEQALELFARHYESDEQLPVALLNKMLAAKNFHSAMQMVRQIEFALFDFLIHRDYGSSDWRGIDETLENVRSEVAAYPAPAFNRFAHSFSHIFAGGYAAGYYSYKWAEVLSADAFSLFEERGIFDRETGARFYREVLAQGGSQEPAQLFENFRGRPASSDALLRHSGICT